VIPVEIPWTRLPLRFDAARLCQDLSAIPDAAWTAHFNANDYAGGWSSVSLRSRSGRSDDIVPRGGAGEFSDTPLAARCPHLAEAAARFEFPKKSVRLLRLQAGSRVREHCDPDLGLADGEVRIHVPLLTNDRVEFVVANRRLLLAEGEAWYIDFSQPHRIANDGDTDRIHLVIDGVANEWVLELIRRSVRECVTESFEPEGAREFEAFRQRVFEDPALQASLLCIADPPRFCAAVVAAGERCGFRFQLGDVESGLLRRQREWSLGSSRL